MPVQMLPLTDEFAWNEIAARYVDLNTGKFVSRALIAQELEKVIKASEVQMSIATQSLMEGSISVAEWQLNMEKEVKILHTASAATAMGGWAQMSQADWGAVGSLVKKQYVWLDRFAVDMYSGFMPMSGRVVQRARLYAQAGRGTYEEMRRRLAMNQGYEEERRLLAPAEHCDTCISEAFKDWQPIGTLRQIGDSECTTNCRCRFDFR